jgi:hypothetical protein
MWQIIGMSADLVVEGRDEARGAGRFRGRVIAVAVEGGDAGPPPPEATTWLLIADDSMPAPIWIEQRFVTGQRLGR